MKVLDAVAAAIRDHGPISFAEYMELALYGPDGFYEHPPVGPSGDFVTSPHVHPVFAELLARAVVELHDRLGGPSPFRVTEVGAGDGTLARQLLGHLGALPLAYVAIERTTGARAALGAIAGLSVAERLDGTSDLIIANELLDNLPFRRFRRTPSGLEEVRIGLDGQRLVELLDPAADDVALTGREAGLAIDEELVLPEGALGFVEQVASRLAHPGYALLIDYGAVGEPGGAPHGYRGHRPVADLLDRPGSTDITVGVDFDLIVEHAKAHGLVASPSVTQRHALTALGYDRWVREELRRQADLLHRREGVEAVRTWGGRSRASLLVDPTALGRLRWLLLATPGTDPPSWV